MNSIEVTAFVARSLDQLQIPWMIVGAYSRQRRKDLDDVVGILAVSGPTLDWNYLSGWAEKHGTADLLKQLAASVNDLNLPPELT